LKNLTKKQNEALIKKSKKGNLSGYRAAKRKAEAEFLRSNPDKQKKNN